MVAPHGRHDGTRGPRGRSLAALAVLLVLALAGAQGAAANGDPASHFLLVQDVFLPFQQRLSNEAKNDLVTAVEGANARGYEVKVAVINTPSDLGTVANLFGSPQEYAEYLGGQIGFQFQGHLLIAMPQGLGLSRRGGEADPDVAAVADVRVAEGSDATARAAITAVARLAALDPPGGGFPVLPVAAAAASLLVVGGLVGIVLLSRRRQPVEPESESSTTT